MSGEGADEDSIAARLFPSLPKDPRIGRYRRNLVGHVAQSDFRKKGGSGGFVSWILTELLERGEVDAVLHVKPASPETSGGRLFRYGISDHPDDIRAGAKSRYYPIEMSDILSRIRDDDRRFAIVGLPCFIKAIRLLQQDGSIPEGRIAYCIGLVCGHLKSRHFADYLAWQKGVSPDEITKFDFRHKILDRRASDYGFAVSWQPDGTGPERHVIHPMASVNGRDWGEGMMKNPACEYCDDVMAECADVVVGDAWLPDHVDDWRGTNVLTIRDETIDRIVSGAGDKLAFEDLSVDDVALSQAAGLRHRRDGLAHRLARRQQARKWAPLKRVAPALAREPSRRTVYDLRERIALESSAVFARALACDDLSMFERRMKRVLSTYRRATKGSVARRLFRRLRRIACRAA